MAGQVKSPPLIEYRLAVGLDVFDVGDDRKAGSVQIVQPVVAALAFVAGVLKRLAQAVGKLLQGCILAGEAYWDRKAIRGPRREKGWKLDPPS